MALAQSGNQASLIGHWPFDETSGTTASDLSGNNLHGNLVNGAQWNSNGQFDGAVICDGIKDYVEIPDNNFVFR